jgi:hypothetical protein
MLRRARLIAARAIGTESDMMATLEHNAGACLEALGDAAGAESLYRHASSLLERILSSDHPSTRVAQESLAGLADRVARKSTRTQARTIAVFLAI